jgi:hypothetical protein
VRFRAPLQQDRKALRLPPFAIPQLEGKNLTYLSAININEGPVTFLSLQNSSRPELTIRELPYSLMCSSSKLVMDFRSPVPLELL